MANDACKGDVGRIEGMFATALATDNKKLHDQAMGLLLNGVDRNQKLPDQVKACNTQRVNADANHPWLQTLTVH
jgi:hypothetical protein